jgi:diguanylate cyclase (GGDEF)-like protein
MTFDIATTLILETLAAFMSALVLGGSLLGTPGPGALEATASMACLVPGFLLYLLRGRIPEPLAIVGSSVLFWMTGVLLHRAVSRFVDDRPPRRWPIAVPVVALVPFAALASSGDYYGLRVLLTSFVLCTLVSASVWELARGGGLTKEPGRRYAFALLVLAVLGLVVRIAIVLPDWHIAAAPLAPTLETTLAFVPALLLAQGFGPAFLLMQRERSAALAARLATTDVLTGCLNRRALEERAKTELAYAKRKQRPLALAVVDLDHFKRVNDTYGHAVGDALLARAGEVLRTSVRPGDIVARYGGEEFCVLLRDADAELAGKAAERLCASLRSASVDAGGTALSPRASVGVAALDPSAEGGWESLFRRADEALYRSKREGRDRVSIDGL